MVLVVVAVGLWAFEPWRLFTSSEIDEPVPTVAEDPPRPSAEPEGPRCQLQRRTPDPVELGGGDFESAEHETSGRARVIELADGSRFVRLEDLAGSDGPDLHVWLTDQPSGGDWGSYDDGRYLRLGELKATHGNQNYEIPDVRGPRRAAVRGDLVRPVQRRLRHRPGAALASAPLPRLVAPLFVQLSAPAPVSRVRPCLSAQLNGYAGPEPPSSTSAQKAVSIQRPNL